MVFRYGVVQAIHLSMLTFPLLIGKQKSSMQSEIEAKRQYHNGLSNIVLGAVISVHKEMGPGLLEGVYQHCMKKELRTRGMSIFQSVSIPLSYKGEPLNKDYFIDLLVENEIVIELKAVEGILPVHEAQICIS